MGNSIWLKWLNVSFDFEENPTAEILSRIADAASWRLRSKLVGSWFVVTPVLCSGFVISSFAIISLRKRELVD